jgi:sucrose-6-phosphate hydrolase SacC (GH32 family)
MLRLFCPVSRLCLFGAVFVFAGAGRGADDLLIADFEGENYGAWRATGEAFGPGPARGTLANQMPVGGYLGERLANSYFRGDATQGTLTSPEFKIERRHIKFLIGGGKHPEKTCINLIIDGKVARTATGPSSTPQDTEYLSWHAWDVSDLAGKTATLEIVDRHSGGWGHINIDHIVQTDRPPQPIDEREDLLARAAESVRRAAARVKDDPNRPIYHVLPPANWMNDPNGPLFHKGQYHLFYQHNPYGDGWGHMHWGHVRSKDLVHWEHLPIALWPTRSKGEQHVFSGCAAVNRRGQPMLFYTSIGNRLPEQWIAVPEDDDLVRWRKHSGNPIMTEKLHGATKVHEWRDPYVFRHGGRDYMVIGGNLNANKGGQGSVQVYRSDDDELTRWTYLGTLFTHPDREVKNIECPLFFELGGKWVLIVSPHRSPEYFVGALDDKTMKFTAQHRGVVDPGHFYAPNVLQLEGGRRILWGWINGFKGGQGWNGCLTLPRELTLSDTGHLVQRPVGDLTKLREKKLFQDGPRSVRDTWRVASGNGNQLEVKAKVSLGDAKAVSLRVRAGKDKKQGLAIRWDGATLDVGGARGPLKAAGPDQSIELNVLVDRSVIEVYAGGLAFSRVLAGNPDSDGVEITSEGGEASVQSLELWKLGSAWIEPASHKGGVRVGAAAVELEADDSMVIAGGIGPGKARGQEGKLRAVAVVLAANETKLAIVGCDVLMFTRELLDPVLSQIQAATGIPPSHILVNATHTHHAPSTVRIHGYPANELFSRRLQEGIRRAVEQASAALSPDECTLGFHLAEEKSVGQNSRLLLSDHTIFWTGRRNDIVHPTGPFDPQLPVLAFRGSDEKLKALIFNHSTHTIGTRKPGVRSPSFYGLAAQELESELGGTALFLEGASGSTHNLSLSGSELTHRVKHAVRTGIDQAQPLSVTKLAAVREPFTFKVRAFDEQKEDEAVSSYCEKRLPAGAKQVVEVFREMRKNLSPQQGQTRETHVQALVIGDGTPGGSLAIVGVPAEFFTVLGLEIKRRSPFKRTYVAELANDWVGYLPDKEAHRLGGYQTWTGYHSYAEPGTGERMVEQAIEMLNRLADRDRAP